MGNIKTYPNEEYAHSGYCSQKGYGSRPLAGKNQSPLVRRNAFIILNLCLSFHVVDGVGRLDLERDGLPGQGLDKYLHTATKTKEEMKCRFLLDVVVGEGTTILELLPSEDETLLIRGSTLGYLLCLGSWSSRCRVRGLDFQGDSFARRVLTKILVVPRCPSLAFIGRR